MTKNKKPEYVIIYYRMEYNKQIESFHYNQKDLLYWLKILLADATVYDITINKIR